MPDDTPSALEAAMNLCQEFARTALVLVRMPDPEQPPVQARVSAIVMMLTAARIICRAQPKLDPLQDQILQVYEDTLQKLSEQLVRDLLPEMAQHIEADLARKAAKPSSRDATITSLRALAERAAKDGKMIEPPYSFGDSEGDDGDGNE